MPWKECDPVSLRSEFCRLALVEGANISRLCERFGVSRKTGYKWLTRFREHGEPALVAQSRRPRRFRQPTSAGMERRVLEIRDRHPAWGGRKIRARLAHLGAQPPAASTITAILHRQGRISAEQSQAHQPLQRFERLAPNELWQLDFKGEFRLSNGLWCHPLTMLDDHSRYSLLLRACDNQLGATVQQQLTAAFRRYGLPRAILADNGPPWGVPQTRGGFTQLAAWLMDLDVRLLHGRPYHPQTQGKEERFHRTLKLEVLQGRRFADLRHAQRAFDPWREIYNHERPHEALQLQVPASRYQVSARSYPEHLREFEYDRSFTVRRVDPQGRVVFRGGVHYLSRAFVGRWVGLRPADEDGQWRVYYRSFVVGQLDEHAGRPRRVARGRAASARCARESSPTAVP